MLSAKMGNVHLFFIDKSINKIAGIIRTGYMQIENTSADGVFQALDSRIKILFMILFILLVSFKK